MRHCSKGRKVHPEPLLTQLGRPGMLPRERDISPDPKDNHGYQGKWTGSRQMFQAGGIACPREMGIRGVNSERGVIPLTRAWNE